MDFVATDSQSLAPLNLSLEVQGVHAGYGERNVLHGVDLSIGQGEWLGLLGPNGSGKSTLIACLGGSLLPRAGTVRVAGFDVRAQPLQARQQLGFAVPPEALPSALTGMQCLQVYAAAKQLFAIDANTLGLADALRLRSRLGDSVGTYSFGMRQKLSVLLALLGMPALIVLDEAFNGLDPASSLALKRHLRERVKFGASVLLATHALDVVERYSDRAVLLYEGRIAGKWSHVALRDIGDGEVPDDGLEAAMAEAIEAIERGGAAADG